jgi:hypothetical protein
MADRHPLDAPSEEHGQLLGTAANDFACLLVLTDCRCYEVLGPACKPRVLVASFAGHGITHKRSQDHHEYGGLLGYPLQDVRHATPQAFLGSSWTLYDLLE